MIAHLLKIIGYSVVTGILSGILFFGIGLFFEAETRSTETVLKYDQKRKQYKEKTVVDKDISGDTTAYFTMAGIFIGIVVGVLLALDKSKSPEPNIAQSEPTIKKAPPKIP